MQKQRSPGWRGSFQLPVFLPASGTPGKSPNAGLTGSSRWASFDSARSLTLRCGGSGAPGHLGTQAPGDCELSVNRQASQRALNEGAWLAQEVQDRTKGQGMGHHGDFHTRALRSEEELSLEARRLR